MSGGIVITMQVQGAETILAKAKRAVRLSAQESDRITQEYGQILLDTVQQNASGRPGPNIITGQYHDSIHISERTKYMVAVGTSAPQAMRLEFGFVGVDSLGRHYNQGPFPHFRPAEEEVGPQYLEAMKSAARKWWS